MSSQTALARQRTRWRPTVMIRGKEGPGIVEPTITGAWVDYYAERSKCSLSRQNPQV